MSAKQAAALNLDYLAARHAQAVLAKCKDENGRAVDTIFTNALGVLLEMGIYASVLYLQKEKKEHATVVRRELWQLFGAMGITGFANVSFDDGMMLDLVTENIVRDLDTILLVRRVAERMLIYGRYGAKAKTSQSEGTGGNTTGDGTAAS